MREIKFRAWHKPSKTMIGPDKLESINFETKVVGVYMNIDDRGFHKLRMSDFILMQYTGLKDKKDKEIYEGDIIRWYDIVTADYPVTYVNGVFCLDSRTDENFHHHRYEIVSKWEVIGNIFETPELLE